MALVLLLLFSFFLIITMMLLRASLCLALGFSTGVLANDLEDGNADAGYDLKEVFDNS